MLLDARELQSDSVLSCDLCIIGAGAAGITLARELRGLPLRIMLLESGGLEYEDDSQSLYKGSNVGFRYRPLDICRLRQFGGSTMHWAGNCSPLDPIDFETRSWVPHSGWPIRRADLDPYYDKAQRVLQLGPYRYDVEYWAERSGFATMPLRADRVISAMAQKSPPTRFGEVYRDDIAKAPNVTSWLHATVLKIAADRERNQITHLDCGVLGGGRFKVEARHFVLAGGGIENARLMLLSDGVGNDHDLVGRFFMDHPVIEGAVIYPDATFDRRLYRNNEVAGHTVEAYLKIADEVVRREQLVNARMPLDARSRYILSEGISSYHQLRRAWNKDELPDNLWTHVGNVVSDMGMVMEAVARKSFDTRLFDSADEFGGYLVDTMIEQTPDPDSRITLDEERDAFGQRRARLDWRFSNRDRENLWRLYRLLGAEIGHARVGRLKLQEDDTGRLFDDLLSYGDHHMGTTRMHDDPRHGVVDRDLKVHGLANLWVAGSSVFPTGGHVPPTLTIVALAFRLADHLASTITRHT